MTRPPCLGEEKAELGVKKGPWTPDEDQKLMACIQRHGHGSWRSLPVNAGLQRCGKSCRLRWTNYLRPDIKRGRFSQEEDCMIVHLHALLGNRWSAIASHLPRRTDNEIKNYWNTHLKKRLVQMGIDPVTHNSTAVADDVDGLDLDQLDGPCDILPALAARPVVSSTLSHMSQWECARAEAEARLSRQSCSPTPSVAEFVPSCAPQQAAAATFGTVTDPEVTQDASTSFMSSWKAQVTATLRPSFGVVELVKTPTANPVNLQTFLRNWEYSSLQQPPSTSTPTTTSPSPFQTCADSPIDFPDFASSGAVSEVVSPQYTTASYALPSSAQITERLMASRATFTSDNSLVLPPPTKLPTSFTLPGEFGDSPTSTLLGPDYDSPYTNSPCVSSSSVDSFDLLAAQSLGLINQGTSDQSCTSLNNMFPSPEPSSFWRPLITEPALQPGASSDPTYLLGLPQLNSTFPKPNTFMLSQVGLPNNIPIPQFDFLC